MPGPSRCPSHPTVPWEVMDTLWESQAVPCTVPQSQVSIPSHCTMGSNGHTGGIAGPEFRDKRKCGRPKRERGRSKRERGRSKHERGRYLSEVAAHFGNLCVYEPSALRKKPSDSSKKTPILAWPNFCVVHLTTARWRCQECYHLPMPSPWPQCSVCWTSLCAACLYIIAKLQRVSETYVCTNPVLFGRSLPILRKNSDSRMKPSNFQKKPSGLRRSRAANAFWKGVPNHGINFKDAYRKWLKGIK